MPQQLPSARGQSPSFAHRMSPGAVAHASGASQVVEMACIVETQHTAPAPQDAVLTQPSAAPVSQVSVAPMQDGVWV
jgi:hypothetical protein